MEVRRLRSSRRSTVRCYDALASASDPLMCAPTFFPDSQGAYRFLPAWRARESEIKSLARRGYAKKIKARRLEMLHDTSLCKVFQSDRDKDSGTRPYSRSAVRIENVADRDAALVTAVDPSPERGRGVGKPVQLWLSRASCQRHPVLAGRR